MEAGLAFDFLPFRGEDGATRGDDVVEGFEVGNMFVDDGLVDEGPQRFGGLHFRGVGGLEDEMETFRHDEAGFAVPAGVSSTRTMIRSRPAPASSANRRRSASNSGFDIPFETYQKTSPVAGETNVVT